MKFTLPKLPERDFSPMPKVRRPRKQKRTARPVRRINPGEFAKMLGCTSRTASELMIRLAAAGADVIDTAGNGRRGRRIRAIALKDALEYVERHRITAGER